jgi:hypothetical protein
MLEERARATGLTLSEWVRDMLLAAPVNGRAGGGPTAGVAVAVPQSALPHGPSPAHRGEDAGTRRVRLNHGKFENRLLGPTIHFQ